MTYEYKIIYGRDLVASENNLNMAGAQGFKLINISKSGDGLGTIYTLMKVAGERTPIQRQSRFNQDERNLEPNL